MFDVSFGPMPLMSWGNWEVTLVDASWKGIVLLAAVWVAIRFMPRASAATRHFVWVTAMVGVLVLPVLSAMLPQWRILPGGLMRQATTQAPTRRSEVGVHNDAREVQRDEIAHGFEKHRDTEGHAQSAVPSQSRVDTRTDLQNTASESRLDESADTEQTSYSLRSLLVLTWLAGCLVACLRIGLAMMNLFWLARRSERVTTGPLRQVIDGACRQMGVRPHVALFLCSERLMPSTWGVFRPRVLLPVAASAWSEERRRVVLLHEVGHVKRNDYLAQLLVQAVAVLYWFNPFVWIAARRMSIERESACDDLVLQKGIHPSTYAEHLVGVVSKLCLNSKSACVTVAMAHHSQLESRIKAVLDSNRNRGALTCHILLTRVAALCIACIPLAMVGNSFEVARASDEAATGPQRGNTARQNRAARRELAATVAPNEKKLKKNARDEVIAAVENLGGRVEIDDKAPGKPIIGVFLGRTKVTNDDLRFLKGLKSLRKLNLGWTQIGDAGLEHLKGLTKLETLYFERCAKVTDAGLAHLKGLTNLTDLTISYTSVTDAGIEQVKNLSKLRWLDLTGLPITDNGAKHLHGLKDLKVLFFCRLGDGDIRTPLVTVRTARELRKSLPKCDIIHEPPIDLKATEAKMRRFAEEFRRHKEARKKRIERLIKNGFTVGNIREAVAAIQQLPAAVGKLDEGASKVDRNAQMSSIVDLEEYQPGDKVVFVGLANFEINDAFVAHLRFLKDLEVLDLSNTPITDAALAYLKPLKKLRVLQVHDTKVTDAGLVHLKEFSKLERLSLLNTRVTNAGLVHLKGLTNLTDLLLGDTRVSDTGLEQLKGLMNLELLHLSGTEVSDAGLVHLKGLKKLRLLSLRRTNVTDSGVDALKAVLPKAKIRRRGP